MAFLVCEQASGMLSKSHRTETRNCEIQDGEDVDVLRSPDHKDVQKYMDIIKKQCFFWLFDGSTWFFTLMIGPNASKLDMSFLSS